MKTKLLLTVLLIAGLTGITYAGYNGGRVTVGDNFGSHTATQTVDMNGQAITNSPDFIAVGLSTSTEATARTTADTEIKNSTFTISLVVEKTGGTMTGLLQGTTAQYSGSINLPNFTDAALIYSTPSANGGMIYNSTDSEVYIGTGAVAGAWKCIRTGAGVTP